MMWWEPSANWLGQFSSTLLELNDNGWKYQQLYSSFLLEEDHNLYVHFLYLWYFQQTLLKQSHLWNAILIICMSRIQLFIVNVFGNISMCSNAGNEFLYVALYLQIILYWFNSMRFTPFPYIMVQIMMINISVA